jgi:hypothetical protein
MDDPYIELEQLRKALREERLRTEILAARVGGWEAACAAQIEAIAALVAFIAHGEGEAAAVLAQARAATDSGLPGQALLRRFERAEALAVAARAMVEALENTNRLTEGRIYDVLADALDNYEQAKGGVDDRATH